MKFKGGAEENRELKDAEPETLKCDSYRRGMLQRPHCRVEQSEHRYFSALLPTLLCHDPHCLYQVKSAQPKRPQQYPPSPPSLKFPNDIIPPLTPELVFALLPTQAISKQSRN